MLVSWNGVLIEDSQPIVTAMGEGFTYGYGLFETMKVVEGHILSWDEHMERLIKSCKALGIPLLYDEVSLKSYAAAVILGNQLVTGSIKLLYAKNKEHYDILLTVNQNRYIQPMYEEGFSICIAESKRNPYSKLTYVKSNNYLENLLEKELANKKGFQEAVFMNIHGFVSEGTYTNIFFIKNQTIYTPSIGCGLLPGIMRHKVIETVEKLQLPMVIGEFTRSQFIEAEEIFLTNSLMEIMPVSKVEEKIITLKDQSLTSYIKDKLEHGNIQ